MSSSPKTPNAKESDESSHEEELDFNEEDRDDSNSESGSDDESNEEDDEEIWNELKNARKVEDDDVLDEEQPSKKQKKVSSSGDILEDDEGEVEFVNESFEAIDRSNIIPRAKRSSALRSGLVRTTGSKPTSSNALANISDDDGEADL